MKTEMIKTTCDICHRYKLWPADPNALHLSRAYALAEGDKPHENRSVVTSTEHGSTDSYNDVCETCFKAIEKLIGELAAN